MTVNLRTYVYYDLGYEYGYGWDTVLLLTN